MTNEQLRDRINDAILDSRLSDMDFNRLVRYVDKLEQATNSYHQSNDVTDHIIALGSRRARVALRQIKACYRLAQ